MGRKGPLVLAWILFIFSEAMAAGGAIFLLDEKDKWKNHALFMVVGMVYINGHGMVLFRLLPGVRTRALKYVHALVHTVGAGLAAFAYVDISGKKKMFSKVHLTLAITTVAFFAIQWITSVFVFIYMYANQARRKVFSGWHNFVGICVLQLGIATSITMIQEVHYEEAKNTGGGSAIICLVLYGVFVNLIVLNPYVEWGLVGPI